MININSLTVAFFVIGNIIGSGFFMMPSILAPLGINMLYSWGVTCFMAIVFSYIFGRLYIIFPESSLVSDYFENIALKKTLAMIYWISCIVGNVGVLIALVSSFGMENISVFIGGGIILLLTLLNYFLEYETIERIEIVLSFLKFFLLIMVPLLFFFITPKMFVMPKTTNEGFFKIGITSFWAFVGIETAAIFGSGKDAKNGLLIGVVASTVLYVLVSLFIMGSIPKEVLMTENMSFSLLAEYAGYPFLKSYLSYLISFTIFGSLYGWIAGTAKMPLLYAKSQLFPESFLKKSPSGLSSLGLISASLIVFLLFISISFMNAKEQFELIVDLCVYIVLLLYGMYSVALFQNSNYYFDKLLSILGMLIVLVSFAMDWKKAVIVNIIFVFYILIKIFEREGIKQL